MDIDANKVVERLTGRIGDLILENSLLEIRNEMLLEEISRLEESKKTDDVEG